MSNRIRDTILIVATVVVLVGFCAGSYGFGELLVPHQPLVIKLIAGSGVLVVAVLYLLIMGFFIVSVLAVIAAVLQHFKGGS